MCAEKARLQSNQARIRFFWKGTSLTNQLPAHVATRRNRVGAKSKLDHRALASGLTGDSSSNAAFYSALWRAQREQDDLLCKRVPPTGVQIQESRIPILRMLVAVELKLVAIALAVTNLKVPHILRTGL